jgi:Motility quorum-sensing regulator, toxin of MqsA
MTDSGHALWTSFLIAIGYSPSVAVGGGGQSAKQPHYPLSDVLRLAQLEGSRAVSLTAEADALNELGLGRVGIFKIVSALTLADFYKTMPAIKRQGFMQDVYRPHAPTPRFQGGVRIYCKVQIVQSLVVISFKLK